MLLRASSSTARCSCCISRRCPPATSAGSHQRSSSRCLPRAAARIPTLYPANERSLAEQQRPRGQLHRGASCAALPQEAAGAAPPVQPQPPPPPSEQQQQQQWVWEESQDGARAYAALFAWLAAGALPGLQQMPGAGALVSRYHNALSAMHPLVNDWCYNRHHYSHAARTVVPTFVCCPPPPPLLLLLCTQIYHTSWVYVC